MGLTRKSSTHNRAQQILFEYQPFATDDPRSGIIAYLSHCKAQGNSNRTLSNKLIRLSAFYRRCGIKLDVPRPKFVTCQPEIYSQDDLARFFNACDARQELFFKTLLYGGLRMQEARWLEFDDVEDGVICIRAKEHWQPKTSEERRIPVPKSLTDQLLHLGENRPICRKLVFTTSRGGPDCHALRTCKRIAARAQLDPAKWSLHGFRRTCLTRLVNSGNLGLPTVMAIAGHRDTKSALRYQRGLEGATLRERIESVWG